MSVNPGFGGQSFLPAQPRQDPPAARRRSRRAASTRRIEVDGGVDAAQRARRWWRPAPRSWWPAPPSSARAIPRRRARRLLEAGALSAGPTSTRARALRRDRPDGRRLARRSTSPGSRSAAPTCCASQGCTYRELEARRAAPPRHRGQARYLRPALYDDVLEVRTRAAPRSGGARIAFAYEVHREGTRGPAGHGHDRPRRRRRRGTAAPAARTTCGSGSREGRGHRRRRLHRLAPRREPAAPTATRSSGIDAFVDYYPRAVKERNLAAAARDHRRSASSKGALQDLDLRAAAGRRAARSSTWPPRPACARPGAGTSRSTPTTTCSATQRLLEAAVAAGVAARRVRLVVVGLRRRAARCPCARTSPCQPVSPYGVTKLAAEHLGQLYERNHGLPVVSLRYFTVYGPRQRPDMAFHRFLKAARDGEPIQVFGDGGRPATSRSSTTSWPPPGPRPTRAGPGCVYNVGGGERVSLNDVLELIAAGDGPPARRSCARTPRRATCGTPSPTPRAARRDLGFRSTVTLREGLAREWEWIREAGVRQRAPGRRRCSARPSACAQRRRARHRDPRQQLGPGRSGRPARRPAEKKQWENARQHFKRIVDGFPQSEYGPAARLALGDSYFQEGGTGNYILAVVGLPRVPDPLPLPRHAATTRSSRSRRPSSSRRTAPTATRRRPSRRSRSTSGCSSSTRTPPTPSRPASGSRELPAEPGAGRVPGRATSTSGRARPTAPRSRRYEGILNDYPDYAAPRRGPAPAGRVPRRHGPDRGGPAPPRAPARGVSEERARRGRAASSMAASVAAPPAPPPRRPATPAPSPRALAAPPQPPAAKLKCHFRICKKALDETSLFLLASAKFPGGMRVSPMRRSSRRSHWTRWT